MIPVGDRDIFDQAIPRVGGQAHAAPGVAELDITNHDMAGVFDPHAPWQAAGTLLRLAAVASVHQEPRHLDVLGHRSGCSGTADMQQVIPADGVLELQPGTRSGQCDVVPADPDGAAQ